jgi:hypothetical protein
MRVNRLADVHRVSAHLDRQSCRRHECQRCRRRESCRGHGLPGESSNKSLEKASSRLLAIARPEAVQGDRPFLTLRPCALAWSSVRPTHATSGSLQDLDEVAIGALHQTVEHLDHVKTTTSKAVSLSGSSRRINSGNRGAIHQRRRSPPPEGCAAKWLANVRSRRNRGGRVGDQAVKRQAGIVNSRAPKRMAG